MPDEDESAININGKKNRLLKEDFDKLAEYLNVPIKVRYENFKKKFNVMKKIIMASLINEADQVKFLDIIKERLGRLQLSE